MQKPLLSPGAYLKIIDMTEDFCKFAQKKDSNMVYRAIANLAKSIGDLPLECPIKPVSKIINRDLHVQYKFNITTVFRVRTILNWITLILRRNSYHFCQMDAIVFI